MNHLAAALLLSLATKEINEKNIEEVLNAAGAKVNPGEAKKVVEKCKGKNHATLVKEGLAKLNGMGAGAPEVSKDKKKEEPKKEVKKKEEPKKEEKPDDDDDEGGFGNLF